MGNCISHKHDIHKECDFVMEEFYEQGFKVTPNCHSLYPGWNDEDWYYYPWIDSAGISVEYDDNFDKLIYGYILQQELQSNVSISGDIAMIILKYYDEMKDK